MKPSVSQLYSTSWHEHIPKPYRCVCVAEPYADFISGISSSAAATQPVQWATLILSTREWVAHSLSGWTHTRHRMTQIDSFFLISCPSVCFNNSCTSSLLTTHAHSASIFRLLHACLFIHTLAHLPLFISNVFQPNKKKIRRRKMPGTWIITEKENQYPKSTPSRAARREHRYDFHTALRREALILFF